MCVFRITTKLLLCFLNRCWPGFSYRKSGLEARESNMILAATGNKYQSDQLEQALKTQFPEDEVRYHGGVQHFAFFFSSPDPLFVFSTPNFRGLSCNCGGLCTFPSLKMFSLHTFGLSGHLVKPRPPAESGREFTICPESPNVSCAWSNQPLGF